MHKKCKQEGCNHLELLRGYCLTHYRENFPDDSMCSEEGCDGLVHRRGMCRKCYTEFLDGEKEVSEIIDSYEVKDEVSELRRKNKQLLKKIFEYKDHINVYSTLRSHNISKNIVHREKASGLREATAVALASDWHLYQQVNFEKVNGQNEYNPEIALKRADRFFNGVLNLLDYNRGSMFHIRDLVLWLGGDLLNGYIHPENLETNYGSPIREILFAYDILVSGILNLLKHGEIDRLYVPCSVGNHSRTTRKMRSSTATDNSYEYLLFRMLAKYFENDDRVVFIISEGEHTYQQIYDFDVRYTHGHRVGYYNGMAGIFGPLRKALMGWDTIRKCHINNIGHFHQVHLDSYGFTVNGSLVGYDEYAMSQNFVYEAPSQVFYLVDAKRGKCSPNKIWVD